MPEKTLAQRRADLARAARQVVRHPGDVDRAERATDLRRDYAAEKLATYVAEVVASAPALTPEQRDRIASLLRAGGTR
jgi:hypothetical protein